MRKVPIPRYIDSIPQIFFWEMDEFMILASCFGAGIAFGGSNTLIGFAVGIVASNQFKKYKANGLPGQLNHLFHWKRIFSLNSLFRDGGERSLTN